MACITFPPVTNHDPVISRIGTDDVFCELSFRRYGDEQVLLVCTRVEYSAYTGRYIREELDREICDEEIAEDVASDLQGVAKKDLAETGDYGAADPCSFDEAVKRELINIHREDRDSYMTRAIAHNAAMIAAE
jgi:hypothetical protein